MVHGWLLKERIALAVVRDKKAYRDAVLFNVLVFISGSCHRSVSRPTNSGMLSRELELPKFPAMSTSSLGVPAVLSSP